MDRRRHRRARRPARPHPPPHRRGLLGPALDEARAFLALPGAQRTDPEPDRPHPNGAWDGAARRLWRSCRPFGGTHAERYLRARGLDASRFPALRFHPALAYQDGSGQRRPFPALVAAHLLIAADRDGAGRRTAAALQARALSQPIFTTTL